MSFRTWNCLYGIAIGIGSWNCGSWGNWGNWLHHSNLVIVYQIVEIGVVEEID